MLTDKDQNAGQDRYLGKLLHDKLIDLVKKQIAFDAALRGEPAPK